MWHDEACSLIFVAGGKLFLWGRLQLEVYEVVRPVGLRAVLGALREYSGLWGLKLKTLDVVFRGGGGRG